MDDLKILHRIRSKHVHIADDSNLYPAESDIVVYISICGRSCLCPVRFVAIPVCGRSGLWPFRFVAVPVCGHSGLWPFRSVAVPVCGRFCLWPFRFWPFRFVAVMTRIPVNIWNIRQGKGTESWWLACWLWQACCISLSQGHQGSSFFLPAVSRWYHQMPFVVDNESWQDCKGV